MQFCFYSGFNQMLQEKGVEATARWAKEQGYSSVEFLQLNTDGWFAGVETIEQAKSTKKILKSYDLSTACYSIATNLLNGKTAVEYLKRQAELASELESPFFHHTLIDSLTLEENAPQFDDIFEEILDRASEVANYCKKLGLTCLYEEQGLYFNGAKNLSRFFTEMQKRFDHLGICGDFGNILFVDENATDLLKAFLPYIKHVHIKDYQRVSSIENLPDAECWLPTKGGNYLKDTPLGEGVIPVKDCLMLLKEIHYDGFFSLELINPVENNGNAMQLIKSLF